MVLKENGLKGSGDQIVSDLQQLDLIAQVSNEAALRAHLAEQSRTPCFVVAKSSHLKQIDFSPEKLFF